MAENILKLFEKPCPSSFAVCGKGRSLDTFIADMDLAQTWSEWCIVAINDAVEVLPANYHVWQDWRFTKTKPPPGCIPIRQVKHQDKFNAENGGDWRHLGYMWTNGKEWIDAFFPFREVRDIRGGLGILGEWTTGKAITILGEWLRRHKQTAELLIVGCDAFDDHQDTAKADALPDDVRPADYAKSSAMLGKALEKYLPCFHTVRWYHRELRCPTTQPQPS